MMDDKWSHYELTYSLLLRIPMTYCSAPFPTTNKLLKLLNLDHNHTYNYSTIITDCSRVHISTMTWYLSYDKGRR